jgi:RNA polymerase sigma factor (sigma-70 family)
MTSEEHIISGCKQGDRKAQAELYSRYSRLMFGVCQRYSSSREDAEDVLQIAFVKVFKSLSLYNGKGSFEGWIRRIMVNTAIDQYRSSIKQQFVNIDDLQIHEGEADTEDYAQDDNFNHIDPKVVLPLLQQLPNGYRLVLNLYAVEGHNHREISEILGISEGSSKSQLHKARRYLKKLMIEKMIIKPIDIQLYETGR